MRTFFLQRHIWAAGAWIFVVSFSGGMLTEIGPWYLNLKHPDWKPPDWAFGVIWTTIFVLAAFAWSIAWQRTQTVKQRLTLSTLFIANAL
jgi:tryptophan-rich sensory protein